MRTVLDPVCPGCGGNHLEAVFQLTGVPANSCIVLKCQDAAVDYPRGDLDLVVCHCCGLVFNRAFEPELTEYSPRYEESQGWSPTFRRFHEQLAQELVKRHSLRGGRVLEIGCGKGEFLLLLSEIGGMHGLGFDPGYRPGFLEGRAARRVKVLSEPYVSGHLEAGCDLVCCKMTLEHVAQPLELLRELRRDLEGLPGARVFIMVPDAGRILTGASFEDVYYEHCNYFTEASLSRIFQRSGFAVSGTFRRFHGQYLCLEAKPGEPPVHEDTAMESEITLARSFSERAAALGTQWQRALEKWHEAKRRVVLWGSGSKSLAFVQLTGAAALVEALVDINPARQGSWQPGTGLPIRAPKELVEAPPDTIVVMNPVYREEIETLLGRLGLFPELYDLGGGPE